MSDQQHLFTLTTAEITQLASLDAISHCREVYGECLWLLIEADLRTFDGDKTAKARKVGELVAERAKAAGVSDVVFDRGGNRYAGRVAAIAEGAREGGLNL